MAKSDNPIDNYRRQQRKKELKKNKNARIKARDAKVAATRTLDEVKSEISLLERKRDRNSSKTGLDAIETKKLERLQKELRIVSAESIKRKELAEQAQLERDKELLAAQKTVAGVQKLNESKYSLVERYASVYYDEKLNPFGAPAPGQPKLYYADGEGNTTTMDSRRAVVPDRWRKKFDAERPKDEQEDGGVQDGMGRVVRKRRWDDQGGINDNQQITMAMPPSAPGIVPPPMQQQLPPAPPAFPPPPPNQPQMPLPPGSFPPPPPQVPPPPPPPNVPLSIVPLPPPPPPPPPPLPPTDTSKPPALPAPSKSVLRAAKRSSSSKRTNAMADIWASQEEMEYEQTLGGKSMAMEGTADQNQPQQPYLPRWKRHKKNAKSKEKEADVNDPCCPSADGYGEYRNREQIERQSKEVAKLKGQQQEAVQHVATGTTNASEEQTQPNGTVASPSFAYNIQQPIWYYRDNTSGAIQGPFSGEQMMGWRAFFPVTTPVRFGHDGNGEFVALQVVDFVNPPVPPPPPPPPAPPAVEEMEAVAPEEVTNSTHAAGSVENELEANIEAEAEAMPQLTNEEEAKPSNSETAFAEPPLPKDDTNDDVGGEVEMCLPPPSDDKDDNLAGVGDEENSASGANNDGPEVDMCLPPPSDDENDGNEADMCVPPPSDDEEDEEAGDAAEVPYPAVGEYPEYPVPDDEDAVPYPADVEYPVDDDAYGYPDTGDAYGDSAAAGGEMAAVAPYPGVDDAYDVSITAEPPMGGEQGVMPPAEKKKFDGDKAVVGFMPSHLRVKRTTAKPTKKKKPAVKQVVSSESPKKDQGKEKDESQAKYSVADDYNKFMEEISELK